MDEEWPLSYAEDKKMHNFKYQPSREQLESRPFEEGNNASSPLICDAFDWHYLTKWRI